MNNIFIGRLNIFLKGFFAVFLKIKAILVKQWGGVGDRLKMGGYFQQLSISLVPNNSDQQFPHTVQKYLNLSFIAEFADFVIFKAKFY